MVSQRTKSELGALALLLTMSTTFAAAADEPPPPEHGGDGERPAEPVPKPDAAPTPPSSVVPATSASDATSGGDANTLARRGSGSVHHTPVSSAVRGVDLEITVMLDDPHLVRRLALVYVSGGGAPRELELRRYGAGYGAVLPAEEVGGSLAYCIELERTDGTRIAAFASRTAMHPVQTLAEQADEREERLLARLDGRRSVASVRSEYANFDSRSGTPSDYFWSVEGKYVYRPLRTVAEFSIRGGVIRGEADGKSQVGLNYGAPSVRFRMHDDWHLELEGMASISQEGFSTGGGFGLYIGDPYASHLALGANFVGISEDRYFGSRFYSKLALAAHERVTVTPTVEITDMPSAERWGVRLLADVAVHLGGGFSASVQGGYQARFAEGGGPGVGANAALAF